MKTFYFLIGIPILFMSNVDAQNQFNYVEKNLTKRAEKVIWNLHTNIYQILNFQIRKKC